MAQYFKQASFSEDKRLTKKGPVPLPLSFDEWENAAKRILGDTFDNIFSYGGEGRTQRANVEAFYRWRLVPHVMRDISNRDISVSLCGKKIPAPILIAPMGQQKRNHPQGEAATARAAASTGIPFILSHGSNIEFKEIVRAMGSATRWFQLISLSDREVLASILHQAKSSGFSAILLTVDNAVHYPHFIPNLNRMVPHGVTIYDPVFSKKAKRRGGEEAFYREIFHGKAFTWDDVEFVRGETHLPVIVKGVVNPKDAEEALNYNIDGVVVSNHGAQTLDGEIGTLDALPNVRDAIHGKIPVLIDGGIHSGADVVKALALGASAVMIGHLIGCALAVAGEDGVRQVLLNLISETDKALALCGCKTVAELDKSMITRT